MPGLKIGQGNLRDRYGVAVCKVGDEIVGHLPKKYFIHVFDFYLVRWNDLLHSFRGTAIFKGSTTGWDGN